MDQIPAILNGLPIHWAGVDSTTPDGCMLVVTTVVGVMTTYIIRDGRVLGRIEAVGRQDGYVGSALKGGLWVGAGDSTRLGVKMVARADGKEA